MTITLLRYDPLQLGACMTVVMHSSRHNVSTLKEPTLLLYCSQGLLSCSISGGHFWRNALSEEEKARLVGNIAGYLKDASEFIQRRALRNFFQADRDYGVSTSVCTGVWPSGSRKTSSE